MAPAKSMQPLAAPSARENLPAAPKARENLNVMEPVPLKMNPRKRA